MAGTSMNKPATTPQLSGTIDQDSRLLEGNEFKILHDIYNEDINIAIWRRPIPSNLIQAANSVLDANPQLQISTIATPGDAYFSIEKALGSGEEAKTLSRDIVLLVDMFCCLFGLKHAGLKLTALDRTMCPRFHVDRVPCRLLTTYHGLATEWLPHHLANRSKLGPGNGGKPDDRSGLFSRESDVQKLSIGDVALLKGSAWEGNEEAGLIHRSPKLPEEKNRLLLTLDFANG